ncbi:MAG TPA: PAS domain-containing protein [Solirubrobacteraceae bacterium]|nr:PAS domain-containing protein [Solirubrobacteraceae bacterium]
MATRRGSLYARLAISDVRGTASRSNGSHHGAGDRRDPARALADAGAKTARVLLVGLEELPDDRWTVLVKAGVRLERADDVAGALCALTAHPIPVVIAAAPLAQSLMPAVRGRPELASTHVVVAATLDSPDELRTVLDAGADDVMRMPFEPEVLAARVSAGLSAARLRANQALLRSMVDNIPGALYRGACDRDWTMHWLSDEVETLTGYPASDFIDNSVRTFASVIHPDDREYVERSVAEAVEAHRPFSLEYRIVRRDGEVRWVLERGQAQDGGDGRLRLHGAIFDITVRRAAEQALREREVVQAQLAEVRASRARIVDAADRARQEIERNLHDGAQQRFVSATLGLELWRASHRELSEPARAELDEVLTELRAGLAELRELAHGLHPAVLSDRGLERALSSLADHAPVSVELRAELQDRLAMPIEAAAYFTVAEALTNVAKYARATRAWIDVDQADGCLRVEVGDDGVGGAEVRPGSGLQGLRDRIASVNGSLTIDSHPGAGTILRARLPI